MTGHMPSASRSARRRVPLRLGLPMLAALVPGVAAAQAPAAPARPEYRVVRFDENWAVLRDRPMPAPLDGLKYIPLDATGSIYLSLGGQLRTRGEGVDNFMLADAPERSDAFGLVRALLHADLHAGPYLRFFVEGKHAVAIDRDLPGGRRPLDYDELDLQNAFVDVACCGNGPSGVTARVGRQELLLGSQRLVSPLDWANTRRTFEGGRLMARAGGLVLDGFGTRPVVVDTDAFNERDPETLFWGVALRPAVAAPRLGWDLYLLGLDQGDSTRLWGAQGAHERLTAGGRLTGTLGTPAARFDVEAGGQTGSFADRDVRAWFFASDLSRSFATVALRPTASIGFDYASGDGDPDDDVIGTFHQLYPLGHAYAGYMDVLGRQNLIEARGVVTAAPTARTQLRAAAHRFLRARTTDTAYNVGGAVLPGSTGPERAIGTELDLTAGFRVDRYTRIEVGYGHFRPGGYFEAGASGAVPSSWGYASTSFTF
ncbi:MAG TPA: alginate export family protein [Longimicrobiaceae bacterium]